MPGAWGGIGRRGLQFLGVGGRWLAGGGCACARACVHTRVCSRGKAVDGLAAAHRRHRQGHARLGPPPPPHCPNPQTPAHTPKLQQPVRLLLLGGDGAHHVLIQTLGEHVRLDKGLEAVLVRPAQQPLQVTFLLRQLRGRLMHQVARARPSPRRAQQGALHASTRLERAHAAGPAGRQAADGNASLQRGRHPHPAGQAGEEAEPKKSNSVTVMIVYF